jgi:hypothetical protein
VEKGTETKEVEKLLGKEEKKWIEMDLVSQSDPALVL